MVLRILIFSVLFSFSQNVFAQESEQSADTTQKTKFWKTSFVSGLNFTQSSFTNWAAGGENSISFAGLVNFAANYQKEHWLWENGVDLGYGVLKTGDEPFRKNDDKIDIVSRIGYRLNKKFFSSLRMNFKTQFAPGYTLPNDSVIVSRFMAPGFLFLSLGVDYQAFEGFSISLSPATGRIIFVLDQELANIGAFGVEPAIFNDRNEISTPGENVRFEFGAMLNAQYKHDFKMVSIRSRLELFNNFTHKIPANRGNIFVNWENLVTFNISKWFSTSLFLHLIYDHEQPIAIVENINGVKTEVGKGPRLQIKQVLGIGFNYKFTNVKKN